MRPPGRIERVRVCATGDLPLNEGREVRVGDRPLCVFRTEAGFHALDNTCTHMGGPLADGLVADDTVACPLHDRRFELATGRAVGHDCGGVSAYPVEVAEGEVFVAVPVFELGGETLTAAAVPDTSVAHAAQPEAEPEDAEQPPVPLEDESPEAAAIELRQAS